MNQRLRIPLLAALGAIACHKAKPPPLVPVKRPVEVDLAAEVQSLSKRAEKLLRQQEEAVWKNWIEGAPIRMEKTYEEAQDLFGIASIHKIEQLRARLNEEHHCSLRRPFRPECSGNAAASKQLLALDLLHAHFVGEYLAESLAESTGAIANLEASLTFTVTGAEHRYRDLARLLSTTRTAEGRRSLYAGATTSVERLSEMVRRREEKLDDRLRDFGYSSHRAFGSEIRRADLEQLALTAEQLLQTTEEPYTQGLSTLAQRELGLSIDRLRRYDFERLFRAKPLDAVFGKDALLGKVEETLKGLGISLGELRNLTVDTQSRPAKNPRPLSLAIVVPTDVRISFKPVGGVRDQALLFHEIGHSLPYAFTPEAMDQVERQDQSKNFLPDIRFALNKLGDRAVNEAYALLFDGLPDDPTWLEGAGVAREKLHPHLLASRTYRLFQLRRSAGRLLYELQLHQVSIAEGKALYQRMIGRAYGVPLEIDDQARYLLDRDDLYQSADELRASVLAAQLQSFLVQRFGATWWRSAQAGEFLRGLWSRGNAWSAEDVAEQLGGGS